jgi:hypothetical protein
MPDNVCNLKELASGPIGTNILGPAAVRRQFDINRPRQGRDLNITFLGAQRADVRRLILNQAGRLIVVGLTVRNRRGTRSQPHTSHTVVRRGRDRSRDVHHGSGRARHCWTHRRRTSRGPRHACRPGKCSARRRMVGKGQVSGTRARAGNRARRVHAGKLADHLIQPSLFKIFRPCHGVS